MNGNGTPVVDDPELERRLRETFAAVMPLLAEEVNAHNGGLRRGRFERSGRSLVLLAACAVLLASGVVGVIALTGDDPGSITSGTPRTTTVTAPPTTNRQPSTVGGPVTPISVPWPESDAPEPPWDPIRIAPGTIGWYDIDASVLDAQLVERLGERQSWTPEYASNFYRCASWTMDATGPTCEQLAGGSMVEIASWGSTLGVGTLLAPDDPADVAWGLADGSLWGYGAFITPPEPDEVQLNGVTAYEYRNGDDSYLVWQEAPGQTVWIRSHGLDDATLVALAGVVKPVALPDAMPVLLSLEPEETSPDGSPFDDSDPPLRLAWLDGRPCAGFSLWNECTPLDEGPTLIVERDVAGGGPAVAAVAPAEEDIGLAVTLYELGIQQVEQTFTGGGYDVFAFHPGSERLIAAGLVVSQPGGLEPEVTEEAEFGVEAMLGGYPTDVIAEGRTAESAWVVVRQNPSAAAPAGTQTTVRYGTGEYCWLLVEADGGVAPLCPPADRPAIDVGEQADYHSDLDLFEISHNVRSVSCAGVDMPIVIDDQLDGRRFAVVSCPNPQVESIFPEGSGP